MALFGTDSVDLAVAWRVPTPEELSLLLAPRYHVTEFIERGGMGAVYRAEQVELDRSVALKVLPAELSADPEFVERFRREARTMASLEHGNIVRVHDFGQTDLGHLYFVMELIDGGTLASALISGTLGLEKVLEILIQTAEGLEYAHGRGVIHRDIKPANILIDHAGVAKLADFGLAAPTVDLGQLTQSGIVMGTPLYMAPEQHAGAEVDARADIYALGVVLYSALTGHAPLGAWAPPSAETGCDRRFDPIVARALKPNPDDRYQTVREFKAALIALGRNQVQGALVVPGQAAQSPLSQLSSLVRRLGVLMFTDIVDSVGLHNKVGTNHYAGLLSAHDTGFRRAVAESQGSRIVKHTGDGFLAVFDTASEAVRAALRFQHVMVTSPESQAGGLAVRIGLHQGEIMEETTSGNMPSVGTVGMAVNLAARVMGLAQPGQILLTRGVFDDARLYVREHPPSDDGSAPPPLEWLACGRYLLAGVDDPVEIFEVGACGKAPLAAPPDSEKARRSVSAEEIATLGWRPAAGLLIPRRVGWALLEKLGAGGFGEVWLAQNAKTKERRVFKFCFDPERLRSFKRELTLFRLIRDALGKRDDIATLHEVQVEAAPFYLESDFCDGGNLRQWAEKQGGLLAVPLETRLSLLSRACRALAAAHSIGIIHRDLKPSNIFIEQGSDGTPQPRLADFGIGILADTTKLDELDITMTGFTESLASHASSRTGTRLYAAPETLVGKPSTIQGDIYALGVLLYQLAAGDLSKPLSTGWERDISDPLLLQDIADCVDGDPSRRLASASELAERLDTLDQRRNDVAHQERLARDAAESERSRLQRRRLSRAVATMAALLLLFAGLAAFGWIKKRQAEASQASAETSARRAEASEADTREQLVAASGSEVNQADSLLAEADAADPKTGPGDSLRCQKTEDALLHLAKAIEFYPDNRVAREKFGWTIANRRENLPSQPILMLKHKQYVSTAAFSPNGILIVTASGDRTAQVWEASTGKSVATFQHEAWVNSACFSPDGTKIATASHDGAAHLWDLATGLPLITVLHGGSVGSVAFSPDGTRIVTTSDDLTVQVWNASTGESLTVLNHSGHIDSAAFSQDGTKIITGSRSEGVTVWVAATGKVLTTFQSQSPVGIKTRPCFSPDGTRLATISREGAAQVWDIATSRIIRTFEHSSDFSFVDFSPDGTCIMTTSAKKNTQVCEVATGKSLTILRHQSEVNFAAFSPDGRRIVTACVDGIARVWDVTGGKLSRVVQLGSPGFTVTFSPDSTRIVTGSYLGVQVMEAVRGKAPTVLNASEYHYRPCFSPDGSQIVTVSETAVRMFDATTGKELRTLVHEKARSASFSPDGKRLITTSGSIARVWDVASGKPLATLEPELPEPAREGQIHSATFSPDGMRIVIAVGCDAQLCDAVTSKLLITLEHNLKQQGGGVYSANFSSDGRRIVTSSASSFKVWDCATGKMQLNVAYPHSLNSAVFSTDGTRIVTASEDATAKIWDATTGNLLITLRHKDPVKAATYSPDGLLCATVATDGEVQVWDAATGKSFGQDADSPPSVFSKLSEHLTGRQLSRNNKVRELTAEESSLVNSQVAELAQTDSAMGRVAHWLRTPGLENRIFPDASTTFNDRLQALLSERGEASLQEARLLCPSHPLVLLGMADELCTCLTQDGALQTKRPSPAQVAWLRDFALQHLPEDARIWAQAALCLAEQGEVERAQAALQKAESYKPSATEVKQLLTEVKATLWLATGRDKIREGKGLELLAAFDNFEETSHLSDRIVESLRELRILACCVVGRPAEALVLLWPLWNTELAAVRQALGPSHKEHDALQIKMHMAIRLELHDKGFTNEAILMYEALVTKFKAEQTLQPENWSWPILISWAYTRHAEAVAEAPGGAASALRLYEQGLKARQQALKLAPDDPAIQRNILSSRSHIQETRLRIALGTNFPSMAQKEFAAMLISGPEAVRGYLLNVLTAVQAEDKATGVSDIVEGWLKEIDQLGKSAGGQPKNWEMVRAAGLTLLATAAAMEQRWSLAVSAARANHAYTKTGLEVKPDDSALIERTCGAGEQLAMALTGAGDLLSAEQVWKECSDNWGRSKSSLRLIQQSMIQRRLASLAKQQGKPGKCLTCLRKSVGLDQQSIKEAPEQVRGFWSLALSEPMLAEALQDYGFDPSEIRQHVEEARRNWAAFKARPTAATVTERRKDAIDEVWLSKTLKTLDASLAQPQATTVPPTPD